MRTFDFNEVLFLSLHSTSPSPPVTATSTNFIWSQLGCDTLNLCDHNIYTERQAKKSLTCRIHRAYLEMWAKPHLIQLACLHGICTTQ